MKCVRGIFARKRRKKGVGEREVGSEIARVEEKGRAK